MVGMLDSDCWAALANWRSTESSSTPTPKVRSTMSVRVYSARIERSKVTLCHARDVLTPLLRRQLLGRRS